MANAIIVAEYGPNDELLKVEAGSFGVKPLCLYDLVEQFATRDKLKHNENFGLARQYLFQLDNKVVPDKLHDRDFFFHLRAHVLLLDFFLVQYLDGDNLSGLDVYSLLDFSKLKVAHVAKA